MPLNLSPFLAKKLKKDGHIWPLSIRFSPKSIDMPDGKSPLCPAVTGVLPGVSLGQPFVDKANAQPLGNQSPCNVNIILIDHSCAAVKTLCLKETVRHLVEPGALCTENKCWLLKSADSDRENRLSNQILLSARLDFEPRQPVKAARCTGGAGSNLGPIWCRESM